MSKRFLALIAATIVSIIYGATFTLAKDVMPDYIGAFGFILVRVGGATILFWLAWLIGRNNIAIREEKIEQKDFPRICAAALFGVALNMLAFFKGLSLTSPIAASVLMVTTPIIVLILSAIILKEQMQKRMVVGIIVGLIGTAILIIYGYHSTNESNSSLGNFLVFLNAIFYGFYLVIVKKLMQKYSPFNFAKWIYLIGFVIIIPFGWEEFNQVNWSIIPTSIWLKIIFVVAFSTFGTYMLNLLSMKELKPTTVAVFVYLQPFFATIFAIGLGKDELSLIKIISALLIFVGVYFVIQTKN